MQARNLIITASAAVCGLLAVYLGNAYFSGFEKQQVRVAESQRLAQIVVASQDLAFGAKPNSLNVRLASWPEASVPVGAYTSVEDLMRGGGIAVSPISVGEPVLTSKLSGASGRATLSATLPRGKVAFSIAINDVSGVGGFVRPGDVVDVLLTRRSPRENAGQYDKITDVVVEAAPVLGIDQIYDRDETKPTIPKTATLEVDANGAQKLALSGELGTLSLALRNVADQQRRAPPAVTPGDLTSGAALGQNAQPSKKPRPVLAQRSQMSADARGKLPASSDVFHPAMTVVRGSAVSQYGIQNVD